MANERKVPVKMIARAIKKADRRYFFEDYDHQAESVLIALKEAGYAIVPIDPDTMMIEEGVQAMLYGRVNKYQQVHNIYQRMVRMVRLRN